MTTNLESRVIANLIQGISQQAEQQRRDSQCEAQYDCINSPKDGCVARNGAELIKHHAGVDHVLAYCYHWVRSRAEHYLVVVDGAAPKVYNLQTGNLCAVSLVGGALATYFSNTGGLDPRDGFVAQVVNDTLFIANKTIKPAFTAATAPTRPSEALVFFKAGAYLATFTVSLFVGGTQYRWTYKTPDNSAAGNAEYIGTSQIAATFYRAMTGSSPSAGTDITGGVTAGDPGGSGAGVVSVVTTPGGAPTLASLGFNIAINGNLLRIWRNDATAWSIETTDSAGDTLSAAFKDTVKSFSDLPRDGFEGMTFTVKPGQNDPGDFFVEYVTKNPSSGYWQERAKPGVLTTLDADTMPHLLVNTAPNTFEVRRQTLSTRIAGDGVNSAKDPHFVGRAIEDISFDRGRIVILTEGSVSWSKARNPFTHFPDTVQTVLADAPIGVELAAPGATALLRRVVTIDESVQLWAQGGQFRVHSGQNAFRQDTVEVPPATYFDFSETANHARIGKSLYFASESGDYSAVRNVPFQQGRALGDGIEITDHVPSLIPHGVRHLAASGSEKMVLVVPDEGFVSGRMYVYQFLLQGSEYVQSAWNVWRLPRGHIAWTRIYDGHAYVMLRREDGTSLLRLPLSTSITDGTLYAYRTRLDGLVHESATSGLTYDASTNRSSFTMPYAFHESEEGSVVVVAQSAGGGEYPRGHIFPVVSVNGAAVVVSGKLEAGAFYCGLRIDSRRVESTFYIRGPNGIAAVDDITIHGFHVTFSSTAASRLEVHRNGLLLAKEELKPIVLGQENSAVDAAPILSQGKLDVGVNCLNTECTITMINDSPFPSKWQTAEYRYTAPLRARRSQQRLGEV